MHLQANRKQEQRRSKFIGIEYMLNSQYTLPICRMQKLRSKNCQASKKKNSTIYGITIKLHRINRFKNGCRTLKKLVQE